jgi:hypothetical protein
VPTEAGDVGTVLEYACAVTGRASNLTRNDRQDAGTTSRQQVAPIDGRPQGLHEPIKRPNVRCISPSVMRE